MATQYAEALDMFINCRVFLVTLKLARGDVAGAVAILAQASQSARQQNFVYRLPEVAGEQVLTLLRQGNLATAHQLAHAHALPISQARVYLAQGDTSAALTVLPPLRKQVESQGLEDQRLKGMVLQAGIFHGNGGKRA